MIIIRLISTRVLTCQIFLMIYMVYILLKNWLQGDWIQYIKFYIVYNYTCIKIFDIFGIFWHDDVFFLFKEHFNFLSADILLIILKHLITLADTNCVQ